MSTIQPPKLVSRSHALMYAAFGLMTIAILIFSAYQLAWGYFTGQGLDINLYTFCIEALVFLVTAYFATTQLTSLLAWFGLRRRAKQHTIIAQYDISDVSPAEAGVMLDTMSGKSELLAMIRGLEAKKHLSVAVTPASARLQHLDGREELSDEEKVFIRELFRDGSILTLPVDRVKLLQAYKVTEKSIAQALVRKGYIPEQHRAPVAVYEARQVLKIVSYVVQFILFIGLFQSETWQISYPRYPVQLWQLIFVALLLVIVVYLPALAYWRERYSPQGWEVYRKVSGLYLYMEVALRQQLRQRALAPSELAKLEPYALAFGLVPYHNDALSRHI